MASELSLDSKILIVGGGTWGCSTALHLARRGYKNVTVLDAHATPSPISAGNDINKIVEQGSYSDGDDEAAVSSALLDAAASGWRHDPVFKPYYHDTGYIVAASSPEVLRHLEDREIRHHDAGAFAKLETAEAFRQTMPAGVLTGDFPGWTGYHKPDGAGWVHARKALVAASAEAQRLGVRFVEGTPRGEVVRLVVRDGDVLGAETADGQRHLADRTVLAAGAAAPQLLDFENQLRPTAWTLGHIQMTEEEARVYRNLPVLFNIEKGFFMEPDEDEHQLKICDEHPGYCNWVTQEQPGSGTSSHPQPQSVPMAKHEVPAATERRIRDFLRDTMPHLADRPLVHARLCWCVDTPNRSFLITYHPGHPSLVVASGDSGHGFMHIPSIGGFIADCMEGKLGSKFATSWRWRPETAKEFWGHQTLGRWGGAGHKMLDLKETETEGWTSINSARPMTS